MGLCLFTVSVLPFRVLFVGIVFNGFMTVFLLEVSFFVFVGVEMLLSSTFLCVFFSIFFVYLILSSILSGVTRI